MSADLTTELRVGTQTAGLDFWMAVVARECDTIRKNFNPVPVHDLRVALRRCRSIADTFMTLDPHPAWRLMKDAGRRLFRQLGALRDAQVMLEWVHHLAPVPDEASIFLQAHLEQEETLHRESAAEAVLDFNQKKWAFWARTLSRQTRSIPLDGIVFQHLALERWVDVKALHRRATRDRSHLAFHQLRIALKKFRYTVENFLPSRHERWGTELRELQDLLGEMHDLHVLWQTAMAIKAFRNEKARMEWRRRILKESEQRRQIYRDRTRGENSLLIKWRSELPREICQAALTRFRVWASFHDPDVSHSGHVARLALQIYDGLDELNLLPLTKISDARSILEAAALAHAVGFSRGRKKPHIASYRLIRKTRAPFGLSVETLRQIALIARFHRGPLPRPEQKAFSGIPGEQRQLLILLSGILRLAKAFARLNGRRIYRLQIQRSADALFIRAPGDSEGDTPAEKLAAARHLLEVACRMPVLIR